MAIGQIPQSLQYFLRARDVLPFVGAGVSRAVKARGTTTPLFPSWQELLLAAAEKLVEEGKPAEAKLVRALLEVSPPDYLQSAERAAQAFGKPLFARLLKGYFDRNEAEAEPASLELARIIWRLGSKLVVTTNYDKVLEWTSANSDSWDIEAPFEQISSLQHDVPRSTVWHLHGRITNVENCILTPEGYARLYGEKRLFTAALETLRVHIAKKHLIFIGFSLDDPYIEQTLREVNAIFHGYGGPHYILIKEDEVVRLQ